MHQSSIHKYHAYRKQGKRPSPLKCAVRHNIRSNKAPDHTPFKNFAVTRRFSNILSNLLDVMRPK